LSRGTPILSLGWRAVSLPQALGGQSRLTNPSLLALLDTTALSGQRCRAALLRIASTEL